MIKIVPDPVFSAFVNLTVPGKNETAAVEFEFRHKGRAGLKAWLENAGNKSDAQLLGEIISGWRDVTDQNGADLPYSLERLEELLNVYPASGQEITLGYVFALTESRAKNSGGLLAA